MTPDEFDVALDQLADALQSRELDCSIVASLDRRTAEVAISIDEENILDVIKWVSKSTQTEDSPDTSPMP